MSLFSGYYNIAHPEIEPWNADTAIAGMQPVYSTTEKLKIKGITNRSFAKLTQVLFEKVQPGDIPEVLPENILRQYNLLNRYHSLRWLHFPDTGEHEQMARYRMKWEELFISQLMIARLRLQHIAQHY